MPWTLVGAICKEASVIPQLAKLAQIVLAIPATSGALSEQIFSITGLTIIAQNALLFVSEIVFVHKNASICEYHN